MSRMTRERTRAAVGVTVAVALLLAGCAPSPVSPGESYVSGDGTVTEFAQGSRPDPIEFAGTDEFHANRSSKDYLGNPLVVNFWYAACPPCRVEAPWLEELSTSYADEGVAFLGVNVRDSADTSLSFTQSFGIGYPSIIDTSGSVALAFSGVASATAVPTTVVLDREGRPAARIVGLIDKNVLDALIASVLDESD